MVNKKVAASITAGCVILAAVIGFFANVVTVADFLQGDGPTDSAPVDEQVRQTSAEHAVDEKTQAKPIPAPPTTGNSPIVTSTAAVPAAPETKPRPPSVLQGQAQPAVPDKFSGTWFGMVYQGRMDPYPVEVVITGGTSGTMVGSVDYPTLRCGGRWELQAAWENRIRTLERIEYQGTCLDAVVIDLLMQPDGQLFYSFMGTEGTGILHRRS